MKVSLGPAKSWNAERNDVIDASDTCRLCGYGDRRPEVATIQKEPPIHLLRCPHCGGYSASHMPRPAYLDRYYQEYYSQNQYRWYDDSLSVTFQGVNRFARHVFRSLNSERFSHNREITILDYGGGDGSMGLAFARLFPLPRKTVTVVDYVAPGEKTIEGITLRRLRDIPHDEHFDIVLASGVLEHIVDVAGAMQKMLGALKPGGMFYARTSYAFPFMRLFGHSFDFGYPGHVHDIGPEYWHAVTNLYAPSSRLLASRPSIVETTLDKHFLQTIAAHACKLPARIESFLRGGKPKRVCWGFVAGWEAVLQKCENTAT